MNADSDHYSILFCGDVVGRPGRSIIRQGLPSLKETFKPLFTVVNGENAASGIGITPDNAEEIFGAGADAITLGNHAFHKREIYGYLDSGKAIVRPANMPCRVPGKGCVVVEKEGIAFAVINLCGRVFMDSYGDPFYAIDNVLADLSTTHRLVDFHAEATSEKIAMGYHLDGRVTALVGTHTHVATADEIVLEKGTAYITDVGMTGPVRSVLGMDRQIILERFKTTLPHRFEVANEPAVICGVVIRAHRATGRAVSIERFRFGEDS